MRLEQSLARLSPKLPEFEAGHVWLAGAGPGAVGCLTLDVLSALSQADAIVYDALVDPSILDAARENVQLHFVGKRGGRESARQDDITALLIHLARDGQRVLRLKGGDPYIFGRGGEEALALARAAIPFRILPGVTSGLAALANAGIPATMRGFNKAITLATGHAAGTPDDVDWAALARAGQPIVVYMGLKNLPEIAKALIGGGLAPATPVAVIMAATTPVERVLVATLATVAERAAADGFVSPALIVVGDIVSLRAELAGAAAEAKSA
ncbi:uroporphyrinogen-III C-methyltransferase [Mesorhizobium sp. BAC0120]|uniref:uroporphyrinogen-III C-methyltransferase n=1 Tax=Mesorhizobium sp. BAC0120 TaxID=3090670 RepID=UPI00298CD922|nr:uroporphyrinogen-III C-methyltransferase [Mesorhizobium sp. BAC0120]MDW6020556.1 uroporphyrinogen-III C-methyltransferase [Mesorhizobium sp. BAC0120]